MIEKGALSQWGERQWSPAISEYPWRTIGGALAIFLLSSLAGGQSQLYGQSGSDIPESADTSTTDVRSSPTRAFAAAEVIRIHPVGDFAANADGATAVGGHLRFRLTTPGRLWLRNEIGYTPFSTEHDAGRTHRTLFYFASGPQVTLSDGRIRPHANFSLGVLYHETVAVSGARHRNMATTSLMTSFGAGLDIFLRTGNRPIAFSTSVSWRRAGEMESVEISDIGIEFPPYETEMLTYQAGISVWLSTGD